MRLLRILIYLNLFFLESYLVRFSILSYPSNLQEIIIASTAIVFLIIKIKKRELISTIKNLSNYKVLIFFIIGAIIFSTLVNIENTTDLIRYLKFTFFGALSTFITLEIFKIKEDRNSLLTIGGYGALAFGLFSLIYNLTGHNVALDYRLLGPLDAAVYLGYYLTPFFLFFAFQALKKEKIAITILLALLIIGTRSMGSLAGSLVIIAIYLFTENKLDTLKKRSTKIALSIATIIILATITYTKILPTLKYENSSLDERGEIWKTSLYLLEKPSHLFFGLGLGQFQANYEQSADTALGHKPLDYIVLQPHNIFLLFIFNYGILGLIALILFTLKLGKVLLTKNQQKPVAAWIMLYFLIHGLIDTPFFKNDMLLLIMLFAEMAISKAQTTHEVH